MNKLKIATLLLILGILSGCNNDSVVDAYSKVDEVNVSVTDGNKTEQTEISVSEATAPNVSPKDYALESSTIQSETTAAETEETATAATIALGPPKVMNSDSGVVEAGAVVEYSNMTFQIEDVVKGDHIDIVYDIMPEAEAAKFIQQIKNSENCWVKTTGYLFDKTGPDKDFEQCIVKCKITNLSDKEKVIHMEIPMYYLDSEDNLNILKEGGEIDMGIFSYDCRTQDFYGEHFTPYNPYGNPNSANKSMYYKFQAGEEFETYLYGVISTHYRPNAKFFIADKFLNGEEVGGVFNLGVGTHLIPLEFD